jgi:uncharacterized protein (UPF0333 family)
MKFKKSQVSIEYLIIIGFVTFTITAILLLALFYSNISKDQIRYVQTESYAKKIISSAETVYYSGQPSKATIMVYLPEGVSSVEIIENNLVFSVDSKTGAIKNAYSSNVPIEGNLSASSGVKKIRLEAVSNHVAVSES